MVQWCSIHIMIPVFLYIDLLTPFFLLSSIFSTKWSATSLLILERAAPSVLRSKQNAYEVYFLRKRVNQPSEGGQLFPGETVKCLRMDNQMLNIKG